METSTADVRAPERGPAAPSQALAERIVQQLLAEGLVRAADAARLQSRLMDGALTPADWRGVIEAGAAAAGGAPPAPGAHDPSS